MGILYEERLGPHLPDAETGEGSPGYEVTAGSESHHHSGVLADIATSLVSCCLHMITDQQYPVLSNSSLIDAGEGPLHLGEPLPSPAVMPAVVRVPPRHEGGRHRGLLTPEVIRDKLDWKAYFIS